jgi:hypothetical protein
MDLPLTHALYPPGGERLGKNPQKHLHQEAVHPGAGSYTRSRNKRTTTNHSENKIEHHQRGPESKKVKESSRPADGTVLHEPTEEQESIKLGTGQAEAHQAKAEQLNRLAT